MIRCNIGVQVRAGSSRLPGKAFLKFGKDLVICNLLKNVAKTIKTLSKKKNQYFIDASGFLLVPESEYDLWIEYLTGFNNQNDTNFEIIRGSTEDVFSRFVSMQSNSSDYIVRLTGDCPIVPDQLITKMIITGVRHRLDYLSNVDPNYRTAPDGFDVEVISGRAFEWVIRESDRMSKSDREHVTTFLKENFQRWMRIAIMGYPLDCSDLKFSIDTEEDYRNVLDRYESKLKKDFAAINRGYGIYEY